eukprot:IDg636t1
MLHARPAIFRMPLCPPSPRWLSWPWRAPSYLAGCSSCSGRAASGHASPRTRTIAAARDLVDSFKTRSRRFPLADAALEKAQNHPELPALAPVETDASRGGGRLVRILYGGRKLRGASSAFATAAAAQGEAAARSRHKQ